MKDLANHTSKWWLVIIISYTILLSLIGFLIIDTNYALLVLFGLLGFSVCVLMYLINFKFNRIESRIQAAEMELQAVGGLYDSIQTKLPLNLGDWAISAHFLNRLVNEIYLRQPKLILECGSGTSTIVICSCLKEIGEGSIISVDHLDRYATRTRNLLDIEDLEDWANIFTAPLQEYELDKGTFEWYGNEFMKEVDSKVDMLLVDGPPAPLQKLSRYPALPLLKDYLADDCLIMLDDSNRAEEKEIVELWSSMLKVDIEYNCNCKGYSLLEIQR